MSEYEKQEKEPAVVKLNRWLGDYDEIQVEYDPFGVAWITNGLDDIEIQTKGVKAKDLEEVVTGLRMKLEEFDPDDDIPECIEFSDSDGRKYEAHFVDECLITAL